MAQELTHGRACAAVSIELHRWYCRPRDVFVAAYGVRSDFLHVPLMFLIPKVFHQQELEKLFRIALWLSIPYTALLCAQFYSPQSAWVNRGIGGAIEGAAFQGRWDDFRPPGTFSFITGVTLF